MLHALHTLCIDEMCNKLDFTYLCTHAYTMYRQIGRQIDRQLGE